MAGEVGFGMEKGQLKTLLIKSKKEPVSCAVGKGKEAGSAYILLDKIKQPKALENALKGQFADIKDPRHGSASVDVEDNPKLVVFRLNKPASGLSVRMLKLVKQVGFSKVKFEYEDGSEPEGLGDEEEEGTESASAEIAASNTDVPPPPPPPPPSAPQIDAKALKERLTALVQRMAQVIGADPSRKDVLMALAKQAQSFLGTNNLVSATQSADELEAALADAPVTGAPTGTAEAQKPSASGSVAYAKSRLAWLAVRKKMETDLETLRKEILAYYKDQDIAADLDARYAERVAPVLANLDEALADTLDMATNATDPTQRTKLVTESRQIIKRYQDFMASEPIFGELDANPFVPLTITKTMTVTLATLAAAVR
jgi:hypothetical protein